MNQYIFLRRMRAPIMLLIFGITAILDEYTGVHYAESWPLYIIAWGVLKLAENAILAQNPPSTLPQYPGYQQPGYQAPGYPQAGSGYPPYAATATGTSTPIVPPDDEERR
ncbi:MAG TPA: hypothetical protein VHX37_00675 [Acidobacteriaceae bacterium]|jgi:hypothetical protein|nr:hypothetical protein [Acidobacteriaceae bacterium]